MNDMIERIRQFLTDRPLMAENNRRPDQMIRLLRQEIDELERAMQAEPRENQEKEAIDAIWFLLSMLILWETDIDGVFSAKHQRNQRKYKPEDFQDGDYDATYARIKREWIED